MESRLHRHDSALRPRFMRRVEPQHRRREPPRPRLPGLAGGRTHEPSAQGGRSFPMSEERDSISRLAREDGRYSREAYAFLFEALQAAMVLAGRDEAEGSDRHLTGQELVAGLRLEARRKFGPMGATVWRRWGIHSTLDWGRIVFLLVDAGMIKRREEDTVDDFREGFDFDEYFVEGYEAELPAEIGPSPTA
ncbi:MAG TPA: hypothetical protein EYG30_13955 [Planctomycetes bacterium]|nr:hypothetical protein [Planctomycetota bacterium]